MIGKRWKRRDFLKTAAGILGALFAFRPRPARAAAGEGSTPPAPRQGSRRAITPAGYVPEDHHWLVCIDIDKCIGCGLCAKACKAENHVLPEPFFFRTWVERYILQKPAPGSGEARGKTLVDSPNGGIDGFPPSPVPSQQMLRAFFVPKMCNLCTKSPCEQVCPVGASFHAPDGPVLIDKTYCIGCGFCVQACPYGCRYVDPRTRTADKCTLCYHRITRGLKTACVEVCPTGARIFGDLKHPVQDDPLQKFIRDKKVQVLKPHLGTEPRLLYAGADKEVR